MSAAVLTRDGRTTNLEDRRQQARDFRITEFSPPWPLNRHPAAGEAEKAAEDWAVYHFHTLVGSSDRFSKIMAANVCTLGGSCYYSTGSREGLEFGVEYLLFLYVMDDEVLHRFKLAGSTEGDEQAAHASGVVQIFLELLLVMMSSFPRDKTLKEALGRYLAIDEKWELSKRDRVEKFLAQAERYPGTVHYESEGAEESPITSAFRNLWTRAAAAMPEDWSLRQAAIDIGSWDNDIWSFKKELVAGEENLVGLISKRDGCSYTRAGEIVKEMIVDRCKDLSLAAAELRHMADSKEENSSIDRENAEKYILLCHNFITSTHQFNSHSSRFLLA